MPSSSAESSPSNNTPASSHIVTDCPTARSDEPKTCDAAVAAASQGVSDETKISSNGGVDSTDDQSSRSSSRSPAKDVITPPTTSDSVEETATETQPVTDTEQTHQSDIAETVTESND